VAGELLVKGVTESDTRGVKYPAGALAQVKSSTGALGLAPGPLFVNATSAGPRGNMRPVAGAYRRRDPGYTHFALAADGTIQGVQFRQRAATAMRARATA
jgi:hypothetical protein